MTSRERVSVAVALGLALLFAALPVLGGSDWPTWRYDAERSAVSPTDLPATMYLQWVREFEPPEPAWPYEPWLHFDLSYEPVVAGSRIFVPSMVNDSVTAYNTADGAEIWRFRTDGPVRFAPAYWNNRVYFVSDDGYLYCVNAATGVLDWKFRGGPSERKVLGNQRLISVWCARGGPVILDNTVYWCAGFWPFEGVFVYALDAATGAMTGATNWCNSGTGAQWTDQPHGGALSFGGPAPQGYLLASGNYLLVPCGRAVPTCYARDTGDFVYFQLAANQARGEWFVKISGTYFYCYNQEYFLSDGVHNAASSYSKLDIVAGARTYTGGAGSVSTAGWTGTIDGTASSLLAADDKLFVMTLEGKLHCFGGTVVVPTTYGPPSDPIDPSPDGWTDTTGNILSETGITEGYCIVLGIGTGRLIEELVLQSDLKIIVVDSDQVAIETLRNKYAGAGVYGTRVVGHVADPMAFEFPPYAASLVVTEDASEISSANDLAKMFYTLPPYGGTTCLVGDHVSNLTTWASAAGLENAKVSQASGLTMLNRFGPLPGSSDWTHQYGSPANTVVSLEKAVKPPLGLLWFGGELPNSKILPRHGHGPPEQIIGGRYFIEGPDGLSAVDVYTGRWLWEKTIFGFGAFHDHTAHEPGANSIGTNYVATQDGVYVANGQVCLRLDPATGDTLAEFYLPKEAGDTDFPEWGYVGVWDDLLVAGSKPVIVNDPPFDYTGDTQDYCSSRRVVVMDRYTGEVAWTISADAGFRHNSICMGAGYLFVIDRLPAAVIAELIARGETVVDNPRIRVFDVRTGGDVWDTDVDVFGTWLAYSAEYNVLIQSGRPSRDMQAGEPNSPLIAYNVSDWSVRFNNSGSYGAPLLLYHDMIIGQYGTSGFARSILDAGMYRRANLLTGVQENWAWHRTYGCNTAIASEYLLTFRSGAAGYHNLKDDGGTGNLGGFKSGCTSNLIPANGVLNAPDYTRTCICHYQNQSNMAFVYRPEVEMWAFHDSNINGNPIRRVGVNFGAIGDRRADDGTLWLDYPSSAADSPAIVVTTVPAPPSWFRKHSSLVISGTGAPWVASSGATDMSSMTLQLNTVAPRSYRVRVITAQATGSIGQLTSNMTESTQTVTGSITVNFAPGDWVCGVEIVEQDILNGCAEVTIAATDDTATEGTADTGTFRLTRVGGDTTASLTVNIVVSGSAEADDYVLSGGSLTPGYVTATFPANVTDVDITLTAQSDADSDDETVTVYVENNYGLEYTAGTPATATVNIIDDKLPAVVNHAATNVGLVLARLNGEVVSTGDEDPTVTIYWGDNDGGTTAGNWDNNIDLGTTPTGTFSSDITGLTPGGTYYFRCFASNSYGDAWAPTTESFTTLTAVGTPEVVSHAATNVTVSSAWLHGEVTATGGEDPTVIIYWGDNDGEMIAGNWDNNVNLGTRSAVTFMSEITGLAEDTVYYFRCYATNSAGGAWAPSTKFFRTPTATEVFEARVAAGDDDAEEGEDGTNVYLTSSDLELVDDWEIQPTGIRWINVAIPPGATITNAYVQFQVDEVSVGASSLTIHGEDADNAATFVDSPNNVTGRPDTAASATWSWPDWNTIGEAGIDQRTPDISSIIQEIVDRPGWQSNNALAVVITGTGRRCAESYNGDSSGAPLLHVEMLSAAVPAVVNSAATNVTSTSATLNGEVTSTGGEDPKVMICWGDNDGGTDPANWDHSIDVGTTGAETFSADITGLTSGLTYCFRCYASNRAGGAWAPSTQTFVPGGGPVSTPTVVNHAASSITQDVATLNGEVTATGGEDPTVILYWGDNDAGTTAGNWDNTIILGVRGLGTFSSIIMPLTPDTTYYFRCYASNSGGNAWAPATETFATLAGVGPPTVVNHAATSITQNSATLNGEVISAGGENPTVTIYWGDNDGGTTAGNWDNSVNLGIHGLGNFSSPAAGLIPDTTYYFRCYATNSGGNAWAPATESFDTQAIAVPTLVNRPATNITVSSAWLHGEVISTGGEDPTVTIYWGDNNGGTTAGNWDNSVTLGSKGVVAFTSEITGLSEDTVYYFRCFATNSGGGAWAPSTAVFTTQTAAVVFEVRVSAGDDDAEEDSGGWMDLGSSDLELTEEGGPPAQTIGIRFAGIAISAGATITNAYIQFQVDEVSTGASSLTIHGEDTDDALAYVNVQHNISSRPTTTAFASWSSWPDWNTIGEADVDQRTPDIAAIIQEIVDRPGWQSNNALSVVITGDGRRCAESYNGDSSGAPLLHVEMLPPSVPAVVNSAATDVTANSATLNGEVTSTGGEDPQVIICWGDNDGGTTAGNWDNTINLGIQGLGTFSSGITALTPGTTYYFRCYASNRAGGAWAPSTQSFNTGGAAAPTVVNLAASSITQDSATLNGEVTDTGGEDPTVTIYWGDNDGGTTAGNWDNNIILGVQGLGTFSSGITTLTAGTTYYFRCYASNSGGNAWAASTQSFDTLAGVGPPTVVNHAATSITQDTATLNGEVTDTGGEAPSVTIYWGDNDGGTTAGNWDNNIILGVQGLGTFSSGITTLTAGTTYYFRCYASNSGGNVWAPATESFDTLAGVGPPTVVNHAASSITQDSATLNGELTSTGGEDPTVTIYWGDNDGGTTAGNWDNTIILGVQGFGTFSSGITTLTAGTTYYFRCYASNSGGNVWAPATESFDTLPVGAPTLSVNIPAEATEGDAPVAGTVSISAAPGANLPVNLLSDDETEATVPATVTILAGQTFVAFQVTIVDDGEEDGDQTVTITASSAGCFDGTGVIIVRDIGAKAKTALHGEEGGCGSCVAGGSVPVSSVLAFVLMAIAGAAAMRRAKGES